MEVTLRITYQLRFRSLIFFLLLNGFHKATYAAVIPSHWLSMTWTFTEVSNALSFTYTSPYKYGWVGFAIAPVQRCHTQAS